MKNQTLHPLYNTWIKIKSRCYNPNNVGGAKDGKMIGSKKELSDAVQLKHDYISQHGDPAEIAKVL